MRNGNNTLVQGFMDNIFRCFAVVRKNFKIWGSGPSARASAGRACPPSFEIFSYKHKTPQYAVYKSLNKEVVSVPHYIEETFFDVSNWKLPLRVRLPTSQFSNVDNELIAKTSTLRIKIKLAFKQFKAQLFLSK